MTHAENRRSKPRWTEVEDQTLLSLLKGPKRLSALDIGRVMGRSKSSVCGRAAHFEYKAARGKPGRLRRYTPEMLDRIRALRNDGRTLDEIGLATGIKPTTVRQICSRHRIPSARGWKEEEIKRIIALDIEGKTGPEIAVAVGRSLGGVYHQLAKHVGTKYRARLETKAKRLPRPAAESLVREKLQQAVRRSLDKGWECDITYERLMQQLEKQGGLCFYTGLQIEFTRHSGNAFSIDRKDSRKPYVMDNVVICTWDANRMKQDMSIERFVSLCRLVSSPSGVRLALTSLETR